MKIIISPVAIAKRTHPFPFRTRKLSSSAPMVVGGATPCESRMLPGLSFHSSSVVERSAVNRVVAGSNPACGAIPFGELSEWSKEHDWKSCRRSTPSQGFESLALRHDRFVIMARWSSG
jgi:hypothetical protein